MLVLARKLHQSILIGDAIRITVLEVRNGQVRLGIDAPQGITVLREELIHGIAASNVEACAELDADSGAIQQVAATLRLHLM